MSSGNKRTVQDLTIWAAALIYLALVLFLDLSSPLLGLLLIILAGYRLLDPHSH